MAALQKWCGRWNSSKAFSYSTELWIAGAGIPIDQGPRETEVTGRKIRPITLAESLVKFAESVVSDMMHEDVRKHLEPMQLGCGTPDGNIILLKILQAWAADMEKANAEALVEDALDKLGAVIALDLKNADGMCNRSLAVDEIMEIMR